MTSQTLVGWKPKTPANYYRPVQDEDATAGLSGARMPDGRGILVWPYGGAARFAIVASPKAWLANDIVTTGDMGTIVSGSVRATAVYNIDGGIYCTVDMWTGSNWYLRIYSADNPSNPTSWSLEDELLTALTPGTIFGYVGWGAGIPVKLDSGRWVLVQGGGEPGALPEWEASGTFAHAFYSDNGAAGPWTHTLQEGHYLFGFPRTQWVAAQTASDPANDGDLYFTSGASPPNQVILWRSQDSGGSWTAHYATGGWGGAHLLSPVIDNGQRIFAMVGGDLYVPNTSDPTDLSTSGGDWTADETWTAPGMSTTRDTRKTIIAGSRVYYFVDDQVAPGGGNPWTVGRVAWGERGAWH